MSTNILILGNGSIGMFAAMRLKSKHPDWKVSVVGLSSRENSASVAAGAMCNVFAEVESSFSETHEHLMELSLWYGIAGREGWIDFISENKAFEKIKTASDTLVFLKDGASNFEEANYESSKRTAGSYGVVRNLDPSLAKVLFEAASKKPIDAFTIEGEFALDTRVFFALIRKKCLDLGVEFVDEEVSKIDLDLSQVQLKNTRLRFDKLIIALGSNSSKYLPDGIIQKLVQGVGTAFELSEKGISGTLASKRLVVRTVNRGGAQCGFHFVPRNDGFYLGAGNYIMPPGKSEHRLETLRYLFNTFEKEVCGSEISYRLEGNLVKGHRPRAMDGFPLIGHLERYQNVFVASGTNRAGFTWAPKIANQITAWCDGGSYESTFASLTSPSRNEIDFGSEEEAIRYYTESRISAALEHEKIQPIGIVIDAEVRRLTNYARQLLEDVRRVKRNSEIVPHPDHWAVILEQESHCSD